jgi:hypothetical protein
LLPYHRSGTDTTSTLDLISSGGTIIPEDGELVPKKRKNQGSYWPPLDTGGIDAYLTISPAFSIPAATNLLTYPLAEAHLAQIACADMPMIAKTEF